jgi:short subunit dehydrogenase-like uncharacterized protein
LRPVLAGRNRSKVRQLATGLGLECRDFALDDPEQVGTAVRGMHLVLNCAGPFSRTSAPMRHACIRAGVHYLDITGEIDVFEAAHREDAMAREAGVLLCPGVGFDVVPTDCVAATLKSVLPDATHLDLGFSGVDSMSAGTLVTSMEAIHRGFARVREGGRIVNVPYGTRGRLADFGRGREQSFVIPWGDIATAYYSTGIPDTAVHIPKNSPGARAIRALLPLRRILAGPGGRGVLHPLMRVVAGGPSERRRVRETTRVWGEARNAAGQVRTAVLEGMNGYSLTVESALMAVKQVLESDAAVGYRTPSQLLGPSCLDRIGCRIVVQQGTL